MNDMSAIEYKALMGDGESGGGFGGGAFLWIILIFLFFLAFSGNGIGGGTNSGMAQVERDVLTTSCNTQKEVLENRYANALQFAQLSAQQSACCCELKVAIHTEGEQTRALIQANTIQDLRDKVTSAEAVLSNAAQSQYLLNNLGKFVPLMGQNYCGCNQTC